MIDLWLADVGDPKGVAEYCRLHRKECLLVAWRLRSSESVKREYLRQARAWKQKQRYWESQTP